MLILPFSIFGISCTYLTTNRLQAGMIVYNNCYWSSDKLKKNARQITKTTPQEHLLYTAIKQLQSFSAR